MSYYRVIAMVQNGAKYNRGLKRWELPPGSKPTARMGVQGGEGEDSIPPLGLKAAALQKDAERKAKAKLEAEAKSDARANKRKKPLVNDDLKKKMEEGTATYEEVSKVSNELESRIANAKKQREEHVRAISALSPAGLTTEHWKKLPEAQKRDIRKRGGTTWRDERISKNDARKIKSLEKKVEELSIEESRLAAERAPLEKYLFRF